MPRHTVLVLAAALSAFFGVAALAQHQQPHGNSAPAGLAGDPRALVRLPADLREHMLSNMRDHLLALHEIQDALSRGETDKAASTAEQRLGMSSLSLHGAQHVAKFMPQGMQDVGSGMHRAASRFAIAAQDAGVTGDLRAALRALSDVTAQCVGCHAAYRVD